MPTRIRCPRCHELTRKSSGRLVRAGILSLAWTAAMAMVFVGIMLGPAIMFVLPVVVWGGIATVSAGHEYAFGSRTCEACGVDLDDGALTEPGAIVPEAELEQERALAA